MRSTCSALQALEKCPDKPEFVEARRLKGLSHDFAHGLQVEWSDFANSMRYMMYYEVCSEWGGCGQARQHNVLVPCECCPLIGVLP